MMKRKFTLREPLSESKRMKLEEEGFRTRGWSGDLTEVEFDRLLMAEQLFDVKRNKEDNFRSLNPLDKHTPYWFYCEEHGYAFKASVHQLITKGFAHKNCVEDYMGDDFFALKNNYVQGKNDPAFENLKYGAHAKYTWKCDNGHVFQMSPKYITSQGKLSCQACKAGPNSMKQQKPQFEKFFVGSEKKRRFDQIPVTSKEICTWHCDKMLHEIKRSAVKYCASTNHQCKQCSSMKELFPQYEKYYVTAANKLPYDEVTYGSNKDCIWLCNQMKHEIKCPPKRYAKSKHTYCWDCKLLSVISPDLFKELDGEANLKDGIYIDEVTAGEDRQVHWKCLEDSTHPSWKYSVVARRSQNIGHCPECGKRMSGPQRRMKKELDLRKVAFESEKRLPDLRYTLPLRCDFFIAPGPVSKCPIIIEIDGDQHFGVGKRADPVIGKRDRVKNIFAWQNGMHLLRVDVAMSDKFGPVLEEFLQDIKHTPVPTHRFIGMRYDAAYRELAYVEPD